ncbi:MAG: hypothetical protein NVSMB57_06970 [Actinomycetota bacterium]
MRSSHPPTHAAPTGASCVGGSFSGRALSCAVVIASLLIVVTPLATHAMPPARGFPQAAPWASYYSDAPHVNLARAARAFRILNIDADPGSANFTRAQIQTLKSNGRNRVISYLNLGAVERSRTYWNAAPRYLPAAKNFKAQLRAYDGYPDEVWMDTGDTNWQKLIAGYVAPRLVAQGIDGFYFDNMGVIEQSFCNARCRQGALNLVALLRERYPRLLFVMQNATGDITRLGRARGKRFATLLDGISHEEVLTRFVPSSSGNDAAGHYTIETDTQAVHEMQAWSRMNLRPGGHPLWIATEEYVNTCSNKRDAAEVRRRAASYHFSTYVSDKSALQSTICYS